MKKHVESKAMTTPKQVLRVYPKPLSKKQKRNEDQSKPEEQGGSRKNISMVTEEWVEPSRIAANLNYGRTPLQG